ncbi:MAG TPA: pyruvate dehydrogenase (acetyl-transferring) E1 component subunit alpha [Dehalococcoidia bacterium]|nr:pyruvate dehydrogenase (acetyl-transferring) E1 component subunit alpha [Dehalococcoidia bacterium]
MTTESVAGPAIDDYPEKLLHHFLHQMAFIRRFEERCGEMYTKGKIHGFLHLYIGEEACAVGALNALKDQDRVITHYRDHGHAIARGIDPKRIMAELYGRVDGTSRGRGGSMHIFDRKKNFFGGHAIVAGHMPVATGLGLASKMHKDDALTMCIFGDGGVGEGEFHEALNLSVLWNTPVIWFCENNGYGMGVKLSDSIANDIYKIAAAYRMPSERCNGMDVLAVYEAVRAAVKHTRSGSGPYFVEAMTYRYRGHSMADPELYRTKAEVEKFQGRDPIERLRHQMVEAGLLTAADHSELLDRIEGEVRECIEFADSSPNPDISTLFDFIIKEPSNA